MSKRSSPRSGAADADGLDRHLAQFLVTLATVGYVPTTQQAKRRLLTPFIRWAQEAHLAIAELDEARVAMYLARPSRRRCKRGDPERVAVQQFLDYLRDVEVAPLSRSPEPRPAEELIQKYINPSYSPSREEQGRKKPFRMLRCACDSQRDPKRRITS
jgi:hypothetical protein